MKMLFDTNVILDVLLDRSPFVSEAAQLFAAVEMGKLQGMISATTVTTIFYLATKVLGKVLAKKSVSQLLQLFEVASVNRIVLEQAIEADFSDFEDAVLYQSGFQSGVVGIVTRDVKGYKKAKLPIYTPGELLKTLH